MITKIWVHGLVNYTNNFFLFVNLNSAAFWKERANFTSNNCSLAEIVRKSLFLGCSCIKKIVVFKKNIETKSRNSFLKVAKNQ